MSLSPSDLLQRLKQLKVWQENQEQLLEQTKKLISPNLTSASDYQTIEGLSAFDTSNETSPKKNLESQIISPTKTFNELLEEKLAEDLGPQMEPPKIKKPFLKKGAGLERFKLKPSPKNKRRETKRKNSVERSVTPLRAPDLTVKPKATWSKSDDFSEHVKNINAHLNENPKSEQSLYEKQLEKELLIFEALEQRADNSSFCSTNSSVVNILSSTPSKIRKKLEEKKVHWEQKNEDLIETNLEKVDIAQILLRLKHLSERKNLPSISESSDEKYTSESSSSLNSSITSTELEETLKEKCEIGINTEIDDSECPFCSQQIQKKLDEYEEKIRDVINDKNELSEMKKQLQIKERDLFKKMREFEDEKQDILYELETERKKMLKEKQAYQQVKSSQNLNRKERQEISTLKQEVASLTETLKLKDSKNGMTQARLRNQIKQLEKENSNLSEQIEKLTKENAKLNAAQKVNRKSADAKMLQEINKNVNRLQETIKNNTKVDERKFDTEDSLLIMETKETVQYDVFKKNNDKSERMFEDGSKEIKYANGNIKIVSPNGNLIKIEYFNGDKQETNLLEGTVKYFFREKNIHQTTYADGLEVVEFPEGIINKRHPDGKCEVFLPDGAVQTTFQDGSQETKYKDGSIVKIQNGEKILFLPNGQKEIETRDFKRREYPDGTVKILYPDGTQETKYANGRVRIKDASGNLVVDSQI